MPFKMHKIIFFSRKKKKKLCVPTLPKIFTPITRNTLIFLFGHMAGFHKMLVRITNREGPDHTASGSALFV